MASEDDRPAPVKRKRRRQVVGGLLGVGLDDTGGHRRVTQGDDFVLFGGSHETHERMTDIVLRMKERLSKAGRSFSDLTPREFEDLGRDCVR